MAFSWREGGIVALMFGLDGTGGRQLSKRTPNRAIMEWALEVVRNSGGASKSKHEGELEWIIRL
jgi:hypothetical protein